MIRQATEKDAGSLSVPTVAGRPRRRRPEMLLAVLTVVFAGAAGTAAWRVDQLGDRNSICDAIAA